jgi:hypothetical protein
MKHLESVVFAALLFSVATVEAGEIGHFAPGVPSIRDLAVPEPGFYGVLYNYLYGADRVNDANGDEIKSITMRPGPGPGVTLDLDVDVNVYALAPTFIWVSKHQVLGGKYGAYITQTIGNTSVAASLSAQTGSGRNVDDSQFGLGDLFVQPLWLGWTKAHWDFAAGYGFYAPIGQYDTETITLPVVGAVTVEAADNIGLGFWTHQLQGVATWYPWTDRRMAVVTALTYEIHGEQDDFDLTPGDNLTLNWGVSRYLALNEKHTLLLEIGPAGYSSWQVEDDSGRNAAASPVKDEVHAVGVQVGLVEVPRYGTLSFRYLNEFAAEDRFEGESFGLNFAMKF